MKGREWWSDETRDLIQKKKEGMYYIKGQKISRNAGEPVMLQNTQKRGRREKYIKNGKG